ncbi:hypothetical protein [Confluentibacter flavum]|uniref:Nucleotide-diphospho-sugar transferase domain-containing protein n=1 Tax=Confluentibacter flavum TaxID=1909700 RepID=A0A2N3HP57_9FLAO|nr:hypothetical protein [Confluentibacter flavum]PKQ46712.1 hypothetical protein CSW08_01550 [Confluentibacter flavum]
MRKCTFCTIITADYLPFARTLWESLMTIDKNIELYVLVCDSKTRTKESNLIFLNIDDLAKDSRCQRLLEKYGITDEFRWSMKPILMSFLLNQCCEKIIYVDSDIHFYNDFTFLFSELDAFKIIITPHWRSYDPKKDSNNFEKNFNEGLYNAGFIGANKNSLDLLDTLFEMCFYKCEKNRNLSLYDDQKYFDLLPLLDEHVKIIRHKGCNVAEWNMVECPRSLINGEVIISGKYPIIFIHFVTYTIKRALNGEDSLLEPYVKSYRDLIMKYHPKKLDIIKNVT